MKKRPAKPLPQDLSDPHAALSKPALHAMADALAGGDPNDIDAVVRFVLSETRGHWHNRARAMMCRRLKHCGLARSQREALLACILARLQEGRFTEQFKDQLRLAVRLDPDAVRTAATTALQSERDHVRRYAAWVLSLPGRERAR